MTLASGFLAAGLVLVQEMNSEITKMASSDFFMLTTDGERNSYLSTLVLTIGVNGDLAMMMRDDFTHDGETET